MTLRKGRPELNAPVRDGMSLRDMAAALGVNKTELHRWCKLAELSEDVFESRLAECLHGKRHASAKAILEPVPARGRVQRAVALVRNMTPAERGEFFGWLDAVSAAGVTP